MTDPRALLDTYAARRYGEYADRMDEIAPELVAALCTVLDAADRADELLPGRIAMVPTSVLRRIITENLEW